MIDNPALNSVIAKETIRELLGLLTPREFVIAALRWWGMRDTDIAAELGISRELVSARIYYAKKRIGQQRPDLAHLVEGRWMRHVKEANNGQTTGSTA